MIESLRIDDFLPPTMNRRHFITTTAATALSAPFVKAQSKTSLNGAIIGHGEHRYRVDLEWCQAKREAHPVKDGGKRIFGIYTLDGKGRVGYEAVKSVETRDDQNEIGDCAVCGSAVVDARIAHATPETPA